METNKPARTVQEADKFMLRLQDGLKERIAAAAKANGRSMTAEINARLQGSFEPSQQALTWSDLVKLLREEGKKQGATITITVS